MVSFSTAEIFHSELISPPSVFWNSWNPLWGALLRARRPSCETPNLGAWFFVAWKTQMPSKQPFEVTEVAQARAMKHRYQTRPELPYNLASLAHSDILHPPSIASWPRFTFFQLLSETIERSSRSKAIQLRGHHAPAGYPKFHKVIVGIMIRSAKKYHLWSRWIRPNFHIQLFCLASLNRSWKGILLTWRPFWTPQNGSNSNSDILRATRATNSRTWNSGSAAGMNWTVFHL